MNEILVQCTHKIKIRQNIKLDTTQYKYRGHFAGTVALRTLAMIPIRLKVN